MHSTAVADADAVGCPKALVAGAQHAITVTIATTTRETAAAQGSALARRKYFMDHAPSHGEHHTTR
ncbi:hypothetical protein JCM18909_3920 [Cutibacterium acnes JCM 18909]|nr:hypothetical protein JCM18909_3920 [Cutibacterium acnes JCM 18909]